MKRPFSYKTVYYNYFISRQIQLKSLNIILSGAQPIAIENKIVQKDKNFSSFLVDSYSYQYTVKIIYSNANLASNAKKNGMIPSSIV